MPLIGNKDLRYEVRYFGDLVGCDYETGWRLHVPKAESEDVPQCFELLSFADDLPSAE